MSAARPLRRRSLPLGGTAEAQGFPNETSFAAGAVSGLAASVVAGAGVELLESRWRRLRKAYRAWARPKRRRLARWWRMPLCFSGLVAFVRLSYRQLFHDSPARVGATLGLTLLPGLAMVPGLVVIEGWISQWLTTLVPLSAWEARAFTEMSQPVPGMLLMVCVLAPVLEEMLFRGVILRAFLQRYSRGAAIAHSAGVFGLAHMNLYQFVAAFTLGLLAGWLYERTRSLWRASRCTRNKPASRAKPARTMRRIVPVAALARVLSDGSKAGCSRRHRGSTSAR